MKKKIKVCPRCGGRRFTVTAHVTQDWVVDENGAFEKTLQECVEVTHRPDDEDIWNCNTCGYSASGTEFNVVINEDESNIHEKKDICILATVDVELIKQITQQNDLNAAVGQVLTWLKADSVVTKSWCFVDGEEK